MATVLIHKKNEHNGAIRTFKYTLGDVYSNGQHELETGQVSDGYHTFDELYHYRALYNAAFFNAERNLGQHKSKRHSGGEECFGGGWFVVTMNLPTGQISNHYPLEYWDLFDIPEHDLADEWDGHSPELAAKRLEAYLRTNK